MTDFLARLAQRAQGTAPLLQPLIPSRHERGPSLPATDPPSLEEGSTPWGDAPAPAGSQAPRQPSRDLAAHLANEVGSGGAGPASGRPATAPERSPSPPGPPSPPRAAHADFQRPPVGPEGTPRRAETRGPGAPTGEPPLSIRRGGAPPRTPYADGRRESSGEATPARDSTPLTVVRAGGPQPGDRTDADAPPRPSLGPGRPVAPAARRPRPRSPMPDEEGTQPGGAIRQEAPMPGRSGLPVLAPAAASRRGRPSEGQRGPVHRNAGLEPRPRGQLAEAPSAAARLASRGVPEPSLAIRVHIERIEVRAVTAGDTPLPRRETFRPQPAVSLEEYLKQRSAR